MKYRVVPVPHAVDECIAGDFASSWIAYKVQKWYGIGRPRPGAIGFWITESEFPDEKLANDYLTNICGDQ